MCKFIETICVLRGEPQRLPEHQQRLSATFQHHFANAPAAACPQLSAVLSTRELASNDDFLILGSGEERVRCRVLYGASGIESTTFHAYRPRIVRSLRLWEMGDFEYAEKRADRAVLDAAFAQRGTADDVLLLRRGAITDTSIGNVALWDGERWLTPVRPLLAGTHRAVLLRQGVLHEAHLTATDLRHCSRLRVFNAMLAWGEVELDLSVQMSIV